MHDTVTWRAERIDDDEGDIRYEAHGPRNSFVVFEGPNAKADCTMFLSAAEAVIAEQEAPPPPAEGNNLALKRHKSGVWMVRRKPLQSAAREIAEVCLRALAIDPEDFRKRDEVVSAIAPVIGAMLDDVHQAAGRAA